ncbi:hypothetical protein QBC44DRAFT_395746 [Cladorrhinum sp. PSN332]|nr:hypothetical protein QBC44DRAFT_395746 [Cladorrhinum sp. PSN332]
MRNIIGFIIGLIGVVIASECGSNGPPNKGAITLYSDLKYHGEARTLCGPELESGKCIDLPFGTPVLSVDKTDDLDCCLLYRSPCPKNKKHIDSQFYAHSPGLLHQRLVDGIEDLTPTGFDNQVRSVVCPSKVVCRGLLWDWLDVGYRKKGVVLDGKVDLSPFWINLQGVPGHRAMP